MRKLIPPVSVFVVVLFATGCRPGYPSATADFLTEMQTHVNPTQLQQWAQQEIAAAGGQRVDVTNIPAFIGATSYGMPQYAWVDPNGGSPYVHLVWGGGFGHWGLKVGAATFTISSGPRDYYINWVAGIYAWHEIQ